MYIQKSKRLKITCDMYIISSSPGTQISVYNICRYNHKVHMYLGTTQQYTMRRGGGVAVAGSPGDTLTFSIDSDTSVCKPKTAQMFKCDKFLNT